MESLLEATDSAATQAKSIFRPVRSGMASCPARAATTHRSATTKVSSLVLALLAHPLAGPLADPLTAPLADSAAGPLLKLFQNHPGGAAPRKSEVTNQCVFF